MLGYLAQRVLGQYELVLLDEAVERAPAAAAVRAAQPRRRRCRRSAPTSAQFMTWVTLHEVTHAVQFAGVPWLHPHVAGLVRELLRSAEVRLESRASCTAPEHRRGQAGVGDLRHGDLISIVTTKRRARDARPRPGGDGGDRGTRRARDGRRGARPAALAAQAARRARPPPPLAVGALAAGGAAARTRAEAAPVRAGQALLRRDRPRARRRRRSTTCARARGALPTLAELAIRTPGSSARCRGSWDRARPDAAA